MARFKHFPLRVQQHLFVFLKILPKVSSLVFSVTVAACVYIMRNYQASLVSRPPSGRVDVKSTPNQKATTWTCQLTFMVGCDALTDEAN